MLSLLSTSLPYQKKKKKRKVMLTLEELLYKSNLKMHVTALNTGPGSGT